MSEERRNNCHCWTDWRTHTFGHDPVAYWASIVQQPVNQTCLLMDGHEGPHQWTPDDEIMITFVGDAKNFRCSYCGRSFKGFSENVFEAHVQACFMGEAE